MKKSPSQGKPPWKGRLCSRNERSKPQPSLACAKTSPSLVQDSSHFRTETLNHSQSPQLATESQTRKMSQGSFQQKALHLPESATRQNKKTVVFTAFNKAGQQQFPNFESTLGKTAIHFPSSSCYTPMHPHKKGKRESHRPKSQVQRSKASPRLASHSRKELLGFGTINRLRLTAVQDLGCGVGGSRDSLGEHTRATRSFLTEAASPPAHVNDAAQLWAPGPTQPSKARQLARPCPGFCLRQKTGSAYCCNLYNHCASRTVITVIGLLSLRSRKHFATSRLHDTNQP